MKTQEKRQKKDAGGSMLKSRIIGAVIAAAVVLVLFWFMLPPINPTSPIFWRFVVMSMIIFLVCMSAGELRGAAASEEAAGCG